MVTSNKGRHVPTLGNPERPAEQLRLFLTTRELAQQLGVNARTICLWAEFGEIPAFRVGRQWRFRRYELKTWLSKKGIRFRLLTRQWLLFLRLFKFCRKY